MFKTATHHIQLNCTTDSIYNVNNMCFFLWNSVRRMRMNNTICRILSKHTKIRNHMVISWAKCSCPSFMPEAKWMLYRWASKCVGNDFTCQVYLFNCLFFKYITKISKNRIKNRFQKRLFPKRSFKKNHVITSQSLFRVIWIWSLDLSLFIFHCVITIQLEPVLFLACLSG